MSVIQWQCLICGKQHSSQKTPVGNNCKIAGSHTWSNMGMPVNDKDYWRCMRCGRSPTGAPNGYPKESQKCPASVDNGANRNEYRCIWYRLEPSFDIKDWKCDCCEQLPNSLDKLLKDKGIPSACHCSKNGIHNHIWKRVIKTRR